MKLEARLIAVLLTLAWCAALRAEIIRFAIIGDYGTDNANELAVANLVKTSFQPSFIISVGDNNYLGGANIDRAIGKYYHEFIGNYSGSYGAGASSNRFFPALGNHDWENGSGYSAHLNYFILPGNERYYDFVRGPVHVFILNSDLNEPDGHTATSVQALWFSNRVVTSTSPWRIVICQDSPYSSSFPHTWMRWPFDQWRASIVVSGDAHHYERIVRDGLPYIVNGAGGAPLVGFGSATTGSVVRYNEAHGAMLVIATETNITYEFWSVANGGTRIDRNAEERPGVSVSMLPDAVQIAWPTNGTDGYVLESATGFPAGSWTLVAQTPTISGNRKVVTLLHNGQSQRFFRLRR